MGVPANECGHWANRKRVESTSNVSEAAGCLERKDSKAAETWDATKHERKCRRKSRSGGGESNRAGLQHQQEMTNRSPFYNWTWLSREH